MEMEAEKSTFNAFERFLYWFFIPIVFTLVLIGALLSLFDYSVMNTVLKAANKVPGLSMVLPDPKADGTTAVPPVTRTDAKNQGTTDDAEAVANELKQQLAKKEEELKQADNAYQLKYQELKDLQAKLTALEEKRTKEAKTDDEYQTLIRETASMYAKMSPSKSAPIMENLALKEQVLLLSEMKNDDRVRILEKMDPKKAAEASIALKDVTPARDKQIAALQDRLKLNESSESSGKSASSKLSKEDLGQTFANMTPKSAAALLIEMDKTSPAKVTEILNNMDVASRSKVMSSIADQSQETAASITSRLAP